MTGLVKEYKTIWTDETVEDLRQLWNEGHSATEIADSLGGMTRCAVLGKVHRLKLTPRQQGVNPKRRDENPAPRPKRRRLDRPKSAAITVLKPRFQISFISRPTVELTKSQLRAEFAQAVRNTAAMPVE